MGNQLGKEEEAVTEPKVGEANKVMSTRTLGAQENMEADDTEVKSTDVKVDDDPDVTYMTRPNASNDDLKTSLLMREAHKAEKAEASDTTITDSFSNTARWYLFAHSRTVQVKSKWSKWCSHQGSYIQWADVSGDGK